MTRILTEAECEQMEQIWGGAISVPAGELNRALATIRHLRRERDECRARSFTILRSALNMMVSLTP